MCTRFPDPHHRRSRSKCGFCSSFAKSLEQKPHFEPLRRGWGGRKACADEFYPIFDHFWPFWRILCTLLHFGENTVIFGAPANGQLQLSWHQQGSESRIGGYILTASSLCVTNTHPMARLWVLLGSRYPRLPICLRPLGSPKITVFSPKCSKVHKIRQNSQKWSKIWQNSSVHSFRTPPPSTLAERLKVRFLLERFDK